MPRIEYRPKSRLNPASLVLSPYRRNVKSQCGEDGIIERIFEFIGETNKWCVEFGAWDGKRFSNTWNLIKNAGWTGVLIEGDAVRFQKLRKTYRWNRRRTHLINAFVGLDRGKTLDELLKSISAPRDVDLVSIDIDGNDWHVWNSLVRHRPRVVVIEFNPSVENDVYFVQDYDPTVNQGCSLLALIELGKTKGYELIASTDWNAVFVVKELFDRFGIHDNSIYALHEAGTIMKICQGFDGTIFVTGDTRLYWQGGIKVDPERFQMLPPDKRKWRG
jgi:hypothetical protein